ncbi:MULTISPECIES: hypothetical protein [unclassified Nocardiopsis]|uniref:hypothetical protein n=1 Tax=unclassified Nocardiopsis TaxID=2649073 RepID=UPI001A8FBDAF|nr:hypothetical protein [Nocardiopsis sp. TSRI0078]
MRIRCSADNGIAREASADPGPGSAFESAIRAVLDPHLEAGGLQAALLAAENSGPEVAVLKTSAVLEGFRGVLARAQRVDAVHPDLTTPRSSDSSAASNTPSVSAIRRTGPSSSTPSIASLRAR